MHHTNVWCYLRQPRTDLHDASWIAGYDELSAGADDILNFPGLQSFGHFRLSQIISPGAPAAEIRLWQLDVVCAGDGPDQFARLRCDPLRMGEMTRVVIGHALAAPPEFLKGESVGNEKLGQILHLR